MIARLIHGQRIAAPLILLGLLAGITVLAWLGGPASAGPTDDSDGDGIQNQYEDENLDADNDETTNPGPDSDGDGTFDYLDADDDDDGVPTIAESADPNGDGSPQDALDSDFDGQPDYLDADVGTGTTPITSEQKISDLVGGFNGTLDDGDRFGVGLTAIGDLDGDGVVDVAVGADQDDDGGTDRGAVHILFLNADGTVNAEQKISSTDGGLTATLDDGDFFGTWIGRIGDLDGDGVTDIAVGADGDDDGGPDRGAVHILFLNADGTVKAEQKISDSVGGLTTALDDTDGFGWSVDGVGDVDGDGLPDIAVGAYKDDDGAPDQGAIYVLFLNADGTVKAEQKISATTGGLIADLDDSDFFGDSITGLGDLDGDGTPDLAAGAFADDDGGPDRGAVYILFLNPDGTVKAEQKISETFGGLATSLDDLDWFGGSVASVGDLNGDGITDLLVGAPADGDAGAEAGAVYLLALNSDGTVDAEFKFNTSVGGFTGPIGAGDWFGISVAGLGDLDGDGAINFAVGALYDDDGGTNRGAVYVLDLTPDSCAIDSDSDGLLDCYEQPYGNTDGDAFANENDADDDGDGIPTASETADPNGDGDPRDARDSDRDGQPDWLDLAAGPSSGLVEDEQKISDLVGGLSAPLGNEDYFGFSLTSIGDVDADGIEDLAVGATFDDDGGNNRGAVYVLLLNADGTVKAEQKISSTQGGLAGPLDDGDQFGYALGGVGDIDGDAVPDLVVGAFRDDDGGSDAGAVYLLFLNPDGTVRAEQKVSSTQGGLTGPLDGSDYFGYAVGGVGDVDGDGVNDVAVGAPLDDDGGSSRGALYILSLNPDGTVRAEQKISDSSGGLPTALGNGDQFGSAVSALGDLDGNGTTDLAVNARLDDDGGANRGAIYVLFMNPDGTVLADQKISSTTGGFVGPIADQVNFGTGLAGLGDIDGDGLPDLMAGVPTDDDGGSGRGAAYILFLSSDGTVKAEQKISSTEGGLTGPLDDEDRLGHDMASLGDLDGDGKPNIAIGVGYDDDGGTEHGAVYVVDLAVATQVFVNSTGDASDANPGDNRCDTGATNSAGRPECTLRAAIEEANVSGVINTINFTMPTSEAGYASGVWTITPSSDYPAISDAVLIDGSTQPGYVANTQPAPLGLNVVHAVELDASVAGRPFQIIAGSTTLHGLVINGSTSPLLVQASTTITGSIIGSDPTGMTAIPGSNHPIHHSIGSLQLGGTAPEDRNLISGQGSSIYLSGGVAIVEGNLIGTDITGTAPLGTQTRNFTVRSSNNRIGGTNPASANVISGPGVGVSIDGGVGNAVLGNVIVANDGVGIDLSPTNSMDGPTPNDVGDVDTGSNAYLNFPVITQATESGGTVTVDVDLDVPAGLYRIEAFTNPSGLDATGYGEGELFATSLSRSHAGAGVESFQLSFPGSIGDLVTLTATEDLGAGSFGSTSEFSLGATVRDPSIAEVNSTGDAGDATPGDDRCDTGGTNSEGATECTLRAAIEEANASTLVDTIEFNIPNSDPNHLYHQDDATANSLGTPVATTLDDASITDFDPDYPVSQFSWWHIELATDLPDVGGGTMIDGTTQPGWQPNTSTGGGPTDAVLPIVITRTANSQVLNLDGTGSTVRGLNLSEAGTSGFMILLNGDGNHTIDGSWIMVDPVGTSNGGGDDGIWVATLTANNQVGGPSPEDHILIGNGFSNSGLTVISDNTTVQNVWIGVDATGQLLPGRNDIPLVISGNYNTIGTPGAGVVVGSSLNEILIVQGLRNTVQGSSFGFLPDGTSATAAASEIDGTFNLIGGENPGEGNRFYGGEFGYTLAVDSGAGNAILGNTYTGSTGLNIDIFPAGPNTNDPGDGDLGANDLMNHPVITRTTNTGGTTSIDFDLDVPAGDYRIEFYADVTEPQNPTGFGAGEVFVGSVNATHTGSGVETFQATVPTVGTGWIAATATQQFGIGSYGSTSEFGTAVFNLVTTAVVNSTDTGNDATPGDGRCDTGGVNVSGDPECTLLAAITEANASATVNEIAFDIPVADSGYAAGVWVIDVAAALPVITSPVTIDGATQPGYVPNTNPAPLPLNALPVIELDGAATTDGDGFHFTPAASGSTVNALAIGGFDGPDDFGIEVLADNVTITGSAIGVRADGVTDNGSAYGVWVDGADGTMVGGNTAAERNIISGRQNAQIVTVSSTSTQILGNILGPDASTSTIVGAWGSGIQAWSGSDVTIGSPSAPNVIGAPTSEFGIETGATNVTIDSNIFGTDATYSATFDSGFVAIASVGDAATITNNVIANADDGVWIDDIDATVTGNFIGTDPTGTLRLGIRDVGILVRGGAENTVIGGLSASDANTIAFTGGAGVQVSNPTEDPAILGNRIYGNGGLGIDHGALGVTANDSPDADGVLNHPVLSVARASGGNTEVDFDLDVPAGVYRVELFSNPTGADPSGYGEGRVFLDAVTITHLGAGVQTFTETFAGSGASLSATITRDFGGGDFAATSEFSAIVASPTQNVAMVNSTGDATDSNPGDGVCFTGGINADGDAECTLRAAIEELNGGVVVDRIEFAIPASDAGHAAGVWTIAPTSAPLPPATATVFIDGETQSGASCDSSAGQHTLAIELDGSALGNGSDGIVLSANSSTVRGLSIDGFGDNGIELNGAGSVVRCNFVGLGADGLTSSGRMGTAVSINGDENLVGGTTPSRRNILSTGSGTGVEVRSSSTGSQIIGNYIGTDVTGTIAVPNWSSGVYLDGDVNTEISGNVISGNWDGVFASGSTDLTIDDNRIGTDASGTIALANGGYGIWLGSGADNTAVEANVISGNDSFAVYTTSSVTDTAILDNTVGLDVSRTAAVGNGGGVYLFSPAVVERNAIAYNDSDGITLFSPNASGASIQGNAISANLGDGVYVWQADDVVIGGPGAAGNTINDNAFHGVSIGFAERTRVEANTIVNNGEFAVLLEGSGTGDALIADNRLGSTALGASAPNGRAGIATIGGPSNSAFVGNRIANNGGLGIDHDADGVTVNSSSDAWPDYPVITAAIAENGTTELTFSLDAPAGVYLIEIFRNPGGGDPSGYGEGEVLTATTTITHTGSGSTPFTTSLSGSAGDVLALTATDVTGGATYGSTSEFSPTAVVVAATPPPTTTTTTTPSTTAAPTTTIAAPTSTTTLAPVPTTTAPPANTTPPGNESPPDGGESDESAISASEPTDPPVALPLVDPVDAETPVISTSEDALLQLSRPALAVEPESGQLTLRSFLAPVFAIGHLKLPLLQLIPILAIVAFGAALLLAAYRDRRLVRIVGVGRHGHAEGRAARSAGIPVRIAPTARLLWARRGWRASRSGGLDVLTPVGRAVINESEAEPM